MENNKVVRLIGIWRQKEALWNMRSPLYKRADLKDVAIKEIAHEMAMNFEDVRKKLKSLRSVYVAEKKKVDASKASEAGAEDLYVPKFLVK